MELQSVLEARRSMRKYDAAKSVSKEQIEEVVKAAQFAPTWKNSQTGRYYAVIDNDKKEAFKSECLPEFNANNSSGASYIVTTFVKDRAGFNKPEADGQVVPTNELGNGWGCYDLGLQNMCLMLKAKEIGLDTLVMGIRDEGKIRKMFSIPAQETIVSVIAIGYGVANPDMPPRKVVGDILKI